MSAWHGSIVEKKRTHKRFPTPLGLLPLESALSLSSTQNKLLSIEKRQQQTHRKLIHKIFIDLVFVFLRLDGFSSFTSRHTALLLLHRIFIQSSDLCSNKYPNGPMFILIIYYLHQKSEWDGIIWFLLIGFHFRFHSSGGVSEARINWCNELKPPEDAERHQRNYREISFRWL